MIKFSVKLAKKDKFVNSWITVCCEDTDSGLVLSRTVKLFRGLYEDKDNVYHSCSQSGFVAKSSCIPCVYRYGYLTCALPTCFGYSGPTGIHYSGNYHQFLSVHVSDFFDISSLLSLDKS